MSKKHYGVQTARPVSHEIPTPAGEVRLETFIPWKLVRRGVRREVITPLDAPQEFAVEAGREREAREVAQDSALVRALGLAHHWQRLLDEGRYRTMTEIAAAEGMDLGQASRVAQLARLAPVLVEACMVRGSDAPSLERSSAARCQRFGRCRMRRPRRHRACRRNLLFGAIGTDLTPAEQVPASTGKKTFTMHRLLPGPRPQLVKNRHPSSTKD